MHERHGGTIHNASLISYAVPHITFFEKLMGAP